MAALGESGLHLPQFWGKLQHRVDQRVGVAGAMKGCYYEGLARTLRFRGLPLSCLDPEPFFQNCEPCALR